MSQKQCHNIIKEVSEALTISIDNIVLDYIKEIVDQTSVTESTLKNIWYNKIQHRTCCHVFKRGKKNGEKCTAGIRSGTMYCSKHQVAKKNNYNIEEEEYIRDLSLLEEDDEEVDIDDDIQEDFSENKAYSH